MRSAALLTGALVVLGVGALLVPFLFRERELVAVTPAPPAARAVTVFELGAGRTACLGDVVMDPRSDEARMQVGTYQRGTGPALDVALTGAGAPQRVRIPAGFADNAVLRIPVRPPPRAALTRFCVTNRGTRRVGLYGSTELRTAARPILTIAGRRVSGEVALSFYERGRASIASRPGLLVERMSAFRPGWLSGGVLWVLAALAVLGVPMGAVWAWSRAVAQPSQEANASPPESGTASRGTA